MAYTFNGHIAFDKFFIDYRGLFGIVTVYLFIILKMTKKNVGKEKDSVLALIILLLLLSFFFRGRVWIYIAIAIAGGSVLSPDVTTWLHFFWSSVTEFIGKINAWIILTVVFVFIVIPTSFFKNLFGKKDLILKKRNLTSTFQIRNKIYSPADLENPW
ncbi:MAG: hypothetical protein ABI594_19715 [Ginsengibacter sp.]